MPIIFAQSLLMIPPFLFGYFGNSSESYFGQIMQTIGSVLGDPRSMVYNLVYIAMIYFFCYFWTAITFNPFIPGYRPGRRTEDYLEAVIERITYVGAGFLALIAVVPTIIAELLGVD